MWAGRPSTHIVFHREDSQLIPISLLVGGFSLFWGVNLGGFPWHFQLFGLLFVLVTQYLIWGRFVYMKWKKQRTYYAVTDRRAIVVQDALLPITVSAPIETMPIIRGEWHWGGFGTLRFGKMEWFLDRQQEWDAYTVRYYPVFVDIAQVDRVYELVVDQQRRVQAGGAGTNVR